MSLIMVHMTWQNERTFKETEMTWGIFFLMILFCFVPIINALMLVCLAAGWRTSEDVCIIEDVVNFLQRKVNK
jgi:hypothetical protein